MDQLIALLKEIGMPYAYDHFAEGESPDPPFLCYLLPETNHFLADGQVYFKINEVRLELYTDYKDMAVEAKVETCLADYNIVYQKTETWIESEKLYEVLYQFEMKGE